MEVSEARRLHRTVEHLKQQHIRKYQARRLTGLTGLAVWYPKKGHDDGTLCSRHGLLAERYPRYDYSTLHEMLKVQDLKQNLKRTYQTESLKIRKNPKTHLYQIIE